jgi:hypothetical protein
MTALQKGKFSRSQSIGALGGLAAFTNLIAERHISLGRHAL